MKSRRKIGMLPGWALVTPILVLLAGSCDFGDPITTAPTEVEGITGALVVTGGSPASGALVRVYSASAATSARLGAKAAAALSDLALDSVLANGAGKFSFPDLPDGTYNLTASAYRGDTTFAIYLKGIVVVGGVDLGTDTLERASKVSVHVNAASGGGAVVGATCSAAQGAWQATSDSTGTCTLTGVAPGTYQVTVTHGSYQVSVSADVTVAPGTPSADVAVVVVGNTSPTPAAPLLTSPVSGATGVARAQSLKWHKVSGATSYHVQVSTDTVFTNRLLNDSGFADTTRVTGTLAYDTRYYWRVRAKNASGVSPWSAIWSYRTETIPVTLGGAKLVAYWDFDEASGTTLTDRTGKGHTGTILNGTWTTGIRGGGLTFNGASTRVTFAHKADLNLRQFTLSAWIKTSLLDNEGQVILSRQTASGLSAPWNYRLTVSGSIPADGVLPGRVNMDHLTLPTPTRGHSTGRTLVTDGQWHHVVGIARGTNVEVYVDGKLDTVAPMGAVPDTTSLEPLLIGASMAHPNNARFNGQMDEIRIYDAALSATQVDSLYKAFSSGTGGAVSTAPLSPSLASPAHGATGVTRPLYFSWLASAGATSYRIQAAEDSTFTTLVLNDTAVGTTYRDTRLGPNRTYHWRVSARNAVGSSVWSASRILTTAVAGDTTPPGPYPLLAEPAQNAVNVSLVPVMRLSNAGGRQGYFLFQVALDSLFTQIVVHDSLAMWGAVFSPSAGFGHSVGPLKRATTYYGRIICGNWAGISVTPTHRFRTLENP